MTTKQEALKLIEISANLTAEALHAGVIGQEDQEGCNQFTKEEFKELFTFCVDMVFERFQNLHPVEGMADLDEKFATIGEMHKIFAQKFAEYDQKLSTLHTALHGNSRPSRRPL
jgi:hypothetical protein